MGFDLFGSNEEGCKASLEPEANSKRSNVMSITKALPKISAVHYEMMKGIMKRRNIRKEDEFLEEIIQELYNSKKK